MRTRHVVVPCILLCIIALAPGMTGSAQSLKPEMLAQFEQKTGLRPVEIPDTQGAYMGKTHRGYSVVFTAKAGNVWGRYAARLTNHGRNRARSGRVRGVPDRATRTYW